ncbi:MAG TPA: hypothetical protein VFR24_06410 [Candidatus Angelobacter sp.]|nr:hypothetical protein [Candidatus Angelobacter sp.]
MTSLPDTVTIGVQSSGDDDRTERPIIELRRLLADYCKGPYSPDVREFALVFRIGGEMQEFNFEGCERIRRNRKEKYITVDLGFPSSKWKGATDSSIREFLVEAVETGLLCCIRRLLKDRSPVNGDALMNDFAKVKEIFFASNPTEL